MFTARFSSVGIVFAFLLLLITGSVRSGSANSARAQAEEPKNAKVKELHKERLAVLSQLVKQTEADYVTGRVSFDRLHQARLAVLNAKLDLSESDKERIAILEEGVAMAKGHEKTTAQLYKSGKIPASDPLMAKASRLEAEIVLERAKAKSRAKPK
jgi:outer membrane protein TolC